MHAVLLALPFLLLPIGGHLAAPPDGFPVSLWLLGVLAVSVGAPFLMVTTASPMLQHWFSRTGHRAAADPYFLYAAGNAGSLLALVAYPLLVEPRLTLDAAGSGRPATPSSSPSRSSASSSWPAIAASSPHVLLRARPAPRAVVAHEAPLGALRLRPLEPPTRVDQLISTDIASAAPLGGAARGLPADVHRRLLARRRPRFGSRRRSSRCWPPVLLSLLNVLDVFRLPIALSVGLHLLTLLCAATLVHGGSPPSGRPQTA